MAQILLSKTRVLALTLTLVQALTLTLLANTASAHGGVENPAVLSRMQNMEEISDQMKVLSETAKGKRAFDAEALNQAIARIETASRDVVPLFEAEEMDPKTEALPVIWTTFDVFTQMADDLTSAAGQVSGRVEAPDDVNAALRVLGVTCKSCHDRFRD